MEASLALAQQATTTGDEALYERFGRPLEPDHWGEFVAISPDGEAVLGAVLANVLKEVSERFGPDAEVFRIGEQVAGRWR